MLLKLKHKLTAICIISTTTIITIITLIALSFSEKQINLRTEIALENNLLNIFEHLQNQVLSYSWLAQMEVHNTMIIDISTNSNSLSFPGSYIINDKRQTLITLAKTTHTNIYRFNPSKSYDDSYSKRPSMKNLYSNGEHYLSVIASATYNNTYYQIILIQDMKDNDHQIFLMRIFFIFLIILGSILLGFFSFWFVGKAIKPIAISQKEQTDFVAAASHELRSPLAVIRTSTDELIEDDRIEDKHFIHIISRECSQLTRLVNDLLFLSRTDSSHWQVICQPIEIDTLLLDIYDSFLPIAHSRKYILDLQLPDTKQPAILIDAERITQTISILLNNAFTYTPPSSQILISLENIKGYIKISISDNGPGIPDAVKPYIFKRFYRADSSRHASQHYGLGLSVAYEIIKLHHGHISVQDTPGGGATFVILLPLNKKGS